MPKETVAGKDTDVESISGGGECEVAEPIRTSENRSLSGGDYAFVEREFESDGETDEEVSSSNDDPCNVTVDSIVQLDLNESLDPRVKGALEALNLATNDVNEAEKGLEGCRDNKKELEAQLKQEMTAAEVSLGKRVIENARRYYECRELFKTRQEELQDLAQQFDTAHNEHKAARELVAMAEKKIEEGVNFDQSWQTMMNSATLKVIAAENKKNNLESLLRGKTKEAQDIMDNVEAELKRNPRNIRSAGPYFEAKAKYSTAIKNCRRKISSYKELTSVAKQQVSMCLMALQELSLDIHRRRELERGSSSSSGAGELAESLEAGDLVSDSGVCSSSDLCNEAVENKNSPAYERERNESSSSIETNICVQEDNSLSCEQ
eukprot:Nk52_evm34s2039 gene=Nk52_evmTU34s2039